MRGFIAVFAAAAMVVAPVSPGFAANISKSEIEQTLSSQGYRVESWGPRTLGVTVDRFQIRIDVAGPDGDVSYTTLLDEVDGSGISHTILNEFNNNMKFGRVYIDNNGFVILQMDRNSAGGASIKNIESDFDVFLQLISSFLDHLEAKAIA
ncbi:YbjN domain-containing protein [Hyphococcus sp.]|uniref:YbjN domain-containing protein n=1 Tax=Hyphococcus sp. TaxID=2038636 RepID=UPI003CCB8739